MAAAASFPVDPAVPPAAAEARLRLLQLASPALPVGAFSYAEGLEPLVQAGLIADTAALGAWLGAELERGALSLEAACLARFRADLERAREGGAAAATAMAAVRDREGWLLAQREALELRAQQRQMGGSLCQLLGDLGWPLPDLPPGPARPLAWPAAWAWAGLCLEIPTEPLVEAYLHGWTANQISAAVRLVPLRPTEAQRLLLALVPLLARRAAELVHSDPEALWCGGVGAGLAQLGQAELYSRLFRS
jgi:urease accessory protein